MDRRIHFLDQLRSHMMLLGIVLHAAGSYDNLPPGELWPYKSEGTHQGYSILINFIHSFRMQVFFLVAGLFAALPLQWLMNRIFSDGRAMRIAPWLPWGLAVCIALIHVYSGSYVLDAPVGLGLDNKVFLMYAFYFATGMVAYHLREAFFDSITRWGSKLAIALVMLVLFVVTVSVHVQEDQENPGALVWYGAFFLGGYYAFVCWFVLALYRCLCDHFSRLARYLSEASYWVYLIHLPITVAVPMLIEHWPIAREIKFSLVLIMTLSLSVLSYHLLVRSTFIGWLLNGKRHPFKLPFTTLYSGKDTEQVA
ncbi:MAG: hypothetical protein D9N11_14165 [Ketobacter sp.]|nr:MAG: hypothetical protein D9N11_14165 [Ketobacter sp.]